MGESIDDIKYKSYTTNRNKILFNLVDYDKHTIRAALEATKHPLQKNVTNPPVTQRSRFIAIKTQHPKGSSIAIAAHRELKSNSLTSKKSVIPSAAESRLKE